MPTAKSFQNMKIVSDKYQVSGRTYVRVLNEKTGNERQVRWYTDAEYARMYPNDVSAEKAEDVKFNAKKALGFEKGYITIFKGDTYPYLDWFRLSEARYHGTWGWYFVSTDELPDDIPPCVEPVRLNWDEVSVDDNLMPQSAIRTVVESKIFEPSKSEYAGTVGERLDIVVKVVKAINSDGYYGVSTMHIMEDENENQYVWSTNAKHWGENSTHHIRGTIKELKTYKNTKQTVLTRCTEVK